MVTFDNCRKFWLPDRLIKLLPPIYREMDRKVKLYQQDVGFDLGYEDWGKEGQFERFLHIFEKELDEMLCHIDHITQLIDVDKTPCELLPYLAALLGLEPNYDLSCDDQRKEIRDIVNVYKKKGTFEGLYQLTRTFTDFNISIVEFYKNLLVRTKTNTTRVDMTNPTYSLDITRDLTHRRYSVEGGLYKRNCIGVILEANNCDDSFDHTNFRKLKRILDFYLPGDVEYFIIVKWSCQREFDYVANIERNDRVLILNKTRVGAYYSRWWLERQKTWKTRYPDGQYLRHFIGPEIRTEFNYFQNVETVYSIVTPPIPPTATDQYFKGFAEINPLYFGCNYYDGAPFNKVFLYDSGSWVFLHDTGGSIARIKDQDGSLLALAASNSSEKYNQLDGWETINAPGNAYNHFKVGSEYFLSTGVSERFFYYSANNDGPWTYAGYKVYDDSACIVNDRYYFGGGYANYLTQVDCTTKIRSIQPSPYSSLYRSIKQYDNKVIAVGGGFTLYPPIIHEFDASNFGTPNWYVYTDHSSKVPVDVFDDLGFYDFIKQDDGYIFLGYHDEWDHKANVIYKCDLNFENWSQLFIESNANNSYSRFIALKEYQNKLFVGAENPVRAYEFTTLVEPPPPNIQSLTLESSTDIDVVNPNAEIADMLTYNNEVNILYNYDDAGNPTGKGNKVIRNNSPGIWTTSLTLAHTSNYLTLIDNDMYLGHDYFVDNFTQSHSDDSYRFNGSIWENLNSQHVDSGTGHVLGKNKFFQKIGSTYYSFSISNGSPPMQIYSATNPLSWQQYPNYVWSDIYSDFKKGVVFNNKIYFTSPYDAHKIYIFDPVLMTINAVTISVLAALQGFFIRDNKIYVYGYFYGASNVFEIYDITNELSPIEVGSTLGFKTARKFALKTVEVIGDDIVFIGCDRTTNENLIYASKNFQHYVELLREANEFGSNQASHTFQFSAVNGADLFVGLGGVSNVRVKKYNLNY